MRKQLRRRLQGVLEAEMQARFTEFVLRRDIRCRQRSSLDSLGRVTFFIVLEMSQDSEAFNIALAWSAGGGDLP